MKNVTINLSGFFVPALALVFITLKLCGVISWPWLWVLAPIWIPAGAALLITCVVFCVFLFLKGRLK